MSFDPKLTDLKFHIDKIVPEDVCKYFIDFKEDYNCCLISIYENGGMTLRQIGDRLGISFARVKQIETIALKKMKNSRLIS